MISTLSAIGFGFGSAASSFIARAYGAKDQERLACYATHALMASLCHAIALSVFGHFFADDLFRLMGASEAVLEHVMAYARVWFYGCFLIIIPMVGNSIIRATGNTRLPGTVMVLSAMTNIGLDPIFIFGWGPIPEFGIQGAAIASVGSYAVAFIFIVYKLIVSLDMLRFSFIRRQSLKVWRDLMSIAYPAIMTNFTVPISVGITTAFVAAYGDEAVAGFGIASRIESFILVPMFGLASVMGPFTGQNLGAGRVDRMQSAFRWSAKAMIGYSLVCTLLVYLFGYALIGLFDTTDAVEQQSFLYLSLVLWASGFSGIVVSTNSCANAVGRPMIAVVINIGRFFCAYLPLLYVLNWLFGLHGVYLSISLSSCLMALVALYLRRYLVANPK